MSGAILDLRFGVYQCVVDGVERYIGKGLPARLGVHKREAKIAASAGDGTRFHVELAAAYARGATVRWQWIERGLSEAQALALEDILVDFVGIDYGEQQPDLFGNVPARGQLWNSIRGGFGVTSEGAQQAVRTRRAKEVAPLFDCLQLFSRTR